ncbi:MAG: right-handed parallel beta-helix repeat-containing protein, partial [Planctomycetota bacterium]
MRFRWLPGLLCPLALLALLAPSGCDRFQRNSLPVVTFSPNPDGDPVGVSSQIEIDHPLFGGITEMIAGDGVLRIGWEPASDDLDAVEEIVYRVYLAAGPGDQDFENPDAITAPGATQIDFTGLANAQIVYAVVRAVDVDGNEDSNSVEWIAVPNPVRYVDSSAPPGGDGLSPASAYSSMAAAAFFSQGLGGVNFYVAGGVYIPNPVLFEGQFAYGGFASGSPMTLADRDPGLHSTQFQGNSDYPFDVVTLKPGTLLTGLDGVSVAGTMAAQVGIFAEDAFVRITNCQIFNVGVQGIDLRSHFADDLTIEGIVRGCLITNCGSEGIRIDGIPDLSIDNNLIRDCVNEGIESQWIYGSSGIDARVDITRNRIERCGDEGIDLDIAEVSETDPSLSQGARVRAFIRNNVIVESGQFGINLDIDYENSDGIDFRARVEDNEVRANAFGGLRIDGDARASFRVARNVFSANGGPGVTIVGTFKGPSTRLLFNRILANRGGGIAVEDLAVVEVRHCLIRGNAGPGVRALRGFADITDSIIMENQGVLDATFLRHCLLDGESLPPNAGPGVVVGDPLLEHHPALIAFSAAGGTGAEIPVADAGEWAPGDLAEIRDDGVGRTVTTVLGDRIVVDPAPPLPARSLDALFNYLDDDQVNEQEGFLVGSPAIDGGDPLEADRDGSVADLGPIGGDT